MPILSLSHANLSVLLLKFFISAQIYSGISSSIFKWVGKCWFWEPYYQPSLTRQQPFERTNSKCICKHECLLLKCFIFLINELEGPIPNSFQNLYQLKRILLCLFSHNMLDQLSRWFNGQIILCKEHHWLELQQLSNNSFTGPYN